jgi:serine protease Do
MRGFRTFIKTMSISAALLTCATSEFATAQEQPSQAEIDHASALSSAFEKVADIITPSVVNISAVKRAKAVPRGKGVPQDPFFDQFKDFFGEDFMDRFMPYRGPDGFSQQGLGTGVIVDPQGYILTNNHVIGDADEVTIRTHDERTYKAEVVGTDPRTDLAVIKIKSKDLKAAKLGDSDLLKIGEWVVASGNPFGLDNSITAGIVSAKGRSISGGGQFEDFIQTDAAINPGNSGGPLINLRGEVVGINTAIFSKSGGYMGIGFAIPINMARSVMESLISKGRVIRGWLGIGIQNLTEELAQSFNYPSTEGALVGHVEKGGPADKAGVKQGDIITEIGGKKVKNMNELRNMVAAITPDSSTTIGVIREGRKVDLDATIGELPAQAGMEPEKEEEGSATDFGVTVENLTPDIARKLDSKQTRGVIVTSVKPGSPAAEASIMVRDIIVSVNGKAVSDVSEFNAAFADADLKKGVRLVVESRGMERFVFLRSQE